VDFWSWAFSDFRSNALRGVFAEYLVALALDAAEGTRVEWDAYDVSGPKGLRIEVKCAAYLQSWAQRGPSKLVFSGLSARKWTTESGFADVRTANADVYVFAIQTCTDHDRYDATDVDQWEFHVLPGNVIAELGTRSISHATLLRTSIGPVPWTGIAAAIAGAHADSGPSGHRKGERDV